jgi:hypothetical protein
LECVEEKQRRGKLLAGKRWKALSNEEDKLLIKRFEATASTKDLAQQHNRTEGSIQTRLAKLGNLPPTARPRRFA